MNCWYLKYEYKKNMNEIQVKINILIKWIAIYIDYYIYIYKQNKRDTILCHKIEIHKNIRYKNRYFKYAEKCIKYREPYFDFAIISIKIPRIWKFWKDLNIWKYKIFKKPVEKKYIFI